MVGKVQVGGDAPVSIQSMTNTHTYDVQETLDQIKRLEDAGCEIIRVTVESQQSLKVLDKIKAKMNVPLVADIHFAYPSHSARSTRGRTRSASTRATSAAWTVWPKWSRSAKSSTWP